MAETETVTLRLTAEEREAVEALAAGIGVLSDLEVTTDAALVAASEMGLTRLLEDFELPDETVRTRVDSARADLRAHWTRGNAYL